MNDKCSICDSEIEVDEGVQGNFGICPVAFCCWCLSSLTDMVIQTVIMSLHLEDQKQERRD